MIVYFTVPISDPYFSGLGPSKRNLTCLQCKFYIIRHQLVSFYSSFWFLHMKHIRHNLSCSKTFQIFKWLYLSSAVLPHLPSTLPHTGLLKILQVCYYHQNGTSSLGWIPGFRIGRTFLSVRVWYHLKWFLRLYFPLLNSESLKIPKFNLSDRSGPFDHLK